MKKIIVILIFVFFTKLSAFNPIEGNFADNYQYELFRSWIYFGNYPNNNPAFISKDEIVSAYQNSRKDSVTVIFKIQKEVIVGMSELIKNPFCGSRNIPKYHYIAEEFLFRLNTDLPAYIFDLMNDKKFTVSFQNLESKAAVFRLKEVQSNRIIHVKNIQFISGLKTKIILETNIGVINLIFNQASNFTIIYPKKNKLISTKKKAKSIQRIIVNKHNKYENPSQKKTIYKDNNLTNFEHYITNHRNDKIYNKIMNNRIKDIRNFVNANFHNDKDIQFQNNRITIRRKKMKGLSANIVFKFRKDNDGYYIYPDYQYKLEGKHITIDNDIISLQQIRDSETDRILPAISEMILLHRSIGTQLFNFLIHNDQANTILIINGKERQILKFENYANLLLLLNQYWQNRVVYYNILNVKKVNNYIEIESSLISQNYLISDFANIKIQLNDNFKVDLIQVSLFPEIKK
jgi:hypothetical protein